MNPPFPPPSRPSLSAQAAPFRPSLTRTSSTPSSSSSLPLLPTARTQTRLFRASALPSSSVQPPVPHSVNRSPQLGSAALWDPQDDILSPAISSASRRDSSLWGSPYTEVTTLSASPPGTPAEEKNESSYGGSMNEISFGGTGGNDDESPAFKLMSAQLIKMHLEAEARNVEMDRLRAHNASLRQAITPPLTFSSMTRRGSAISSRSGSSGREDTATDLPFASPNAMLRGGLPQPGPEIRHQILYGTIDCKEFLALHGGRFAPRPLPDETFSLRAGWLVYCLVGDGRAREGALKKAAEALTGVLKDENRNSRRVALLLNILLTVATALAVRPQGNYIVQTVLGCGQAVQYAFFEAMRPDFKEIASSQYGHHTVLNMLLRNDMRHLVVDALVKVLGDRAFLNTKGGSRVMEEAFKAISRDQCRHIYDKLAEVMNGHWLDATLSINGHTVVVNLIGMYPHDHDFSHQYLEEILGGVVQVARNSHGENVLSKLLKHPDLRARTLYAFFSSSDPLCGGPDIGRDAIIEAVKLNCSTEDWGGWVKSVTDNINKTPSLLNAVQKPGGIGLLMTALKNTPKSLGDRLRATIFEHTRILELSAPGREVLEILHGSLVHPTHINTTHYPRGALNAYNLPSFAPATTVTFGIGNGDAWYPRYNPNSYSGRARPGSDPAARWGMTIWGERS